MSLTLAPSNKFDFFNVTHPSIQAFGDLQLRGFWMASDIQYDKDRESFKKLDAKTQHLIKMVIGFFFSSDGIVFENISTNFEDELPLPEIKYTYSAIKVIEMIHAQSYGRQLDAIITDPDEKQKLMLAIRTVPSIKKMADWAIEAMNRENFSLLERLVAFLCVEGIFFSSPFAVLFWLRQYHSDVCHGVVSANDSISRDENLHCEFAVHLINLLQKEGHSSSCLSQIFTSAVEVVLEFVRESLPDGLPDMNSVLMTRHVKSVANRWAQLIGLEVLYPDCIQSPFRFMEMLSMKPKENMFERSLLQYNRAPEVKCTFDVTDLDSKDF